MKILLINTFEKSGGAAIACKRLMDALKKEIVEVKMLVRDKQTNDESVVPVNQGRFANILNRTNFFFERLSIFFNNHFSKSNLFKVSIANTGNDITSHPLVKEADIIHLHWINQGFLSLKNIEKLLKLGKPIVWTLHDQWAYTGICHYANGCSKFQEHCFHCQELTSSKNNDLARKVFLKKKQLFRTTSPVTLCGCSQWIALEAQKSSLTPGIDIVSIPNPINIELYAPKLEKKECLRKKYALPLDKKIILFGAANLKDKRKGIDYLIEMARILYTKNKTDYEFLLIGGNSEEIKRAISLKVHEAGYVNNESQMIELYNASDLFIVPSLEDNLPNTIMEAMACGLPCVGFNTGGIPEMIDHKLNGYVAEYKNAEDLANGILWSLGNADELSEKAREKAIKFYNEKRIARKYIELYESKLHLK